MICADCKQKLILYTIHLEDMGIGHYEYGGAPGYDSRPEVVSTCCDAQVLDNRGNVLNPRDLEDV